MSDTQLVYIDYTWKDVTTALALTLDETYVLGNPSSITVYVRENSTPPAITDRGIPIKEEESIGFVQKTSKLWVRTKLENTQIELAVS